MRQARPHRLVTALCALALLFSGAALASMAPANADPTPIVSAVPGKTPSVLDGEVLSLVKIGDTVIAGGTFTSASSWNSTTVLPRAGILAFDATTGVISDTFVPALNGEVDALIPGPQAGTVMAGGSFTKLGTVSVGKVVVLNATTGARVSAFKAPAINGLVQSLRLSGARVFVGGQFTKVGGVAHGGLASLSASTGALDPYMNLQLSGRHNDSGSGAKAPVGVKSLDITPDGSRLVAVGNFKRVDGVLRDQVLLADLTPTGSATLATWTTSRYSPYCSKNAFDSYVRDVSFSPDGSYFVIAATGGGYAGTLCDAAARFETGAVAADVQPSWVAYSGGDTLTAVEITDSAVYVGGHMRWMNNVNGRDSAGQGSVPRPGIVALSPKNGIPLDWNPGRHPRGVAVYTILATDNGLYIGTDEEYIGNFEYKRPRLAFFPLAGGHQVASDATASLPADVFIAAPRSGGTQDTLTQQSFDGSTAGPATTVSTSGIPWSKTRGAFFAGGKIWYGYDDGFLYSRTFVKGAFGPAVKVDPYHDPYWTGQPTGSGTSTYTGVVPALFGSFNANINGLAYTDGRLYYTQTNSSSLFYRYFNADSGIVGSEAFTVSNGLSWSDAQLTFANGNDLYFASRATGQLKRISLVNSLPTGAVTVVNTSRDWSGRASFLAPFNVNLAPVADFSSSCVELTCSFDASASSDPDGSVASYSWDFGDGTTATGPTASRTFADAGDKSVTLTVTDNEGSTGSVTKTVTAVAPIASNISYVDSATSAATVAATSASVTVPAGVIAGDTLVLYGSWADPGDATLNQPWAKVGTRSVTGLASSVWVGTAGPATAGSSLQVTLPASVKSTLTLVVYRNAGATLAPTAIASATDNSSLTHTAPTVDASSGSWVLSYWADKSSWTTGWSVPGGQVQRATALGTGSARITSSVSDGAGPVAAPGVAGGVTATSAPQASTRAISWTIALPPAP
ncbi:MAG: PKD domain-containing protein [Nocardioides sp.]